ncbi:hypothetical protein PCHDK_000527100, partial [Plasmodium chabaudi adami]
YQNVSKCDSYLHLLDNLKKTYEKFRTTIKNADPNLARSLQTLTTIDGKDSYFSTSFSTFDFSNSKCKLKYEDDILEKWMKAQNKKKQKNDKANEDNNSQNPKLQSSGDQTPSPPAGAGGSNDEGKDTDNGSPKGDGVQGDQGGSVDGSGDGAGDTDSSSGTSGTQSSSWPSFDIWPLFFGIASKGVKQLNNAVEFFEDKKEELTKVTDTIKDLYSTSVSNIKNAFNESINFVNVIIDHVNSQLEQVNMPSTLCDNQSGSGNSGDGLPPSNYTSLPPKNSSQFSSETSQTLQSPQCYNGQPSTPKSPQDSSEKGNSNQKNDQGGPQKPVDSPVVKSENCVIKVKGNETTGTGDIYVPKEYKQTGILIIVILIPITLAIMYKYLLSGRKKELKRKKNMKKVINLMEGKSQMQIIIKPVDTKKMKSPIINPVRGEKWPLLNIHNLMQADPVPFINLFFLLIFLFIKEKIILWKDIFN